MRKLLTLLFIPTLLWSGAAAAQSTNPDTFILPDGTESDLDELIEYFSQVNTNIPNPPPETPITDIPAAQGLVIPPGSPTMEDMNAQIQSLIQQTELASNAVVPSMQINLSPTHPQPGEQVVASINDYSSDVFGSTITWSIDGIKTEQATNQREVAFTAGKGGTQQTITATLGLVNGETRTLTRTITPLYLDIIIEPQTRVPDFYQGRALPSFGSNIIATALISGDQVDTNDYIYTWRINRNVVGGGPIRSGNQANFEVPWGKDMTVSVEVAKRDGIVITSRSITVPIVTPTISFYEESPLYGVSNITADKSLSISGNTVTITAEPYNLDSRVYNSPDLVEWKLNRRDVQNAQSYPYRITLQRSQSGGVSELNFHVRNLEQVLQGAEGDLNINF
jgi:hypothetical protein